MNTSTWPAIVLALCAIIFVKTSEAREPISIDDILKIEKIGSVSVSQDGSKVIYDIIRPASAFKRALSSQIIDSLHLREAFIYDVKSRQTKKLFDNSNKASWIGPWSPDGSKFILYNLDVIRSEFSIGVYDSEKGAYVTLPGVPVWPVFGKLGSLDTMLWLSDRYVIYAAASEGDIFASSAGGSTKDRWKAINDIYRGEASSEPALMVYDSGPSGAFAAVTDQHLLLVDVNNGSSQKVISGAIAGFSLAPDKRHLAVTLRSNEFVLPTAGGAIGGGRANGMSINEIRVIDLENFDRNFLVTPTQDLNLQFPIHWSPDSRRISYYAFQRGEIWEKSKPYVYDVTANRAMPLNADHLQLVLPKDGTMGGESAAPVFFIAGAPYVLAPLVPERDIRSGTFGYSRQWRKQAKMLWRLSDNQAPTPVNSVPGEFRSICPGADELLLQNATGIVTTSLSDESVWQPLKTLVGGDVAFASCNSMEGASGANSNVIAVVEEMVPQSFGVRMAYIIKTDSSGSPSKTVLGKDESVAALSGDGGIIATVKRQKAREILYIRAKGDNTPIQITSVNDWVLQRQFPIVKHMTYRMGHASREEQYVAWYMLPIGYEKGKKYPTVAVIYPGNVQHEGHDPSVESIIGSPYNPYLAAARGYVTMWISAPVNPSDKELDIPKQLADAATAAAEEAIKRGFADSGRLIIYGHSAGGYAVASVLTKARQFKVGIAVAGPYNLVSFYGAFSPLLRHDPSAHLELYYATYLEGSMGFMGVAPWQDPERYVRNSPLFQAGKIEAPLLLIHGNDDYVPISQAEEMFTALVRQGKKARFVRYWGEQHIPSHPANRRDSWIQIEKWLDLHLRSAATRADAIHGLESHCCTQASTSTK